VENFKFSGLPPHCRLPEDAGSSSAVEFPRLHEKNRMSNQKVKTKHTGKTAESHHPSKDQRNMATLARNGYRDVTRYDVISHHTNPRTYPAPS